MSPSFAIRAARAIVRAARLILVDPRGAALSLRMAAWVVLVSALARLTSLPRAHGLSAAAVRTPHPAEADVAATAARLAAAIDRVLRWDLFLFKRSCWRRAMVLHRYLALHGIESRINFGVRREPDGSLAGHAWLERHGEPFLEHEPGTYDPGSYVITFTLPRTPASLTSV